MKLVRPKTYFVGATALNLSQLVTYLEETDQQEFLGSIRQAEEEGLNDGEILCSFYAKMCYAALTDKKNKNISRVRDIAGNIAGTIKSGHGSVFEHCFLNFVTTNCSRVFTHELVRHRVGTSFSQTSGRYVRGNEINLVFDPILEPAKNTIKGLMSLIEEAYQTIEQVMDINNIEDFATKKKITSAMRRILPNGQSNEIGFGLNLRSLRNLLVLRTSRHAEWEIRLVFNQIYLLVWDKYPAMFTDVKLEMVDGLNEITFSTDKL